MTQVTATEINTTDAADTQPVEQATPEVTRAPSKKSRATEIFAALLAQRADGQFASNREFRRAVLTELQQQLGVTVSSASTMYNTAKQAAEAADPAVGLGRDPKKIPVRGQGRRGRPPGSKNRPRAVVIATVDTPAEVQSPEQKEFDPSRAEPAVM